MTSWTQEEVNAHLAKFKTKTPVDSTVSPTYVEPDTSHAIAREDEAKEVHPLFRIAVHHRSRRLADPGGRSFKAAVDGLTIGGILKDDSARYISAIEERNEKSEVEETIIEVWHEET